MDMNDEQDYLKHMFECYFRMAKRVIVDSDVISEERLLDAIHGALSGVNYPDGLRGNVLNCLLNDLPLIDKVARKVQETKASLNNVEEKSLMGNQVKSDWMTLDEACKEFSLPKSQVKDRAWRDKTGFPYHQVGKGAAVNYNREEVKKWVMSHKY